METVENDSPFYVLFHYWILHFVFLADIVTAKFRVSKNNI